MKHEVKAATAVKVVIDSETFLQINIPFRPEMGAIEADGIGEVLMTVVAHASVDLEAHEYYAALNKALRQWKVKGA